MAYHTARRTRVSRSLNGLGDASSCGSDQIWDPNATYPGLPPGQCMPRANYTAAQIAALQQQSGSSSGGVVGSILGAILGGLVTPKPTTPVVVAPASTGISTGTALAIGAGALALIVIATR